MMSYRSCGFCSTSYRSRGFCSVSYGSCGFCSMSYRSRGFCSMSYRSRGFCSMSCRLCGFCSASYGSHGFCSTSYKSCVHVYVGLLCNRGVYVVPCCLSTSIYDVDTSPSPSSVCCSAVTQLVLNDTNAQHVVQVSGQ